MWSEYYKRSIIAPISPSYVKSGIWEEVYLAAYPKVYVSDVFIITSVREKSITVKLTLKNEDEVSHRVTVENIVLDDGVKVKDLGSFSTDLDAGEQKTIEVRKAWENPKLWWIDSPHLYVLRNTLIENGSIIDQKDTRFGFREFWCEGPYFVLNGVRLHLPAASVYWAGADKEYAVRIIKLLKDAHIRILRLHNAPKETCWLEAADELGMLIVDESAIWTYARSYALNDPRFWENAAKHWEELINRDKNHPSLVMYSIENEILSATAGAHPPVPGMYPKEIEERLVELGEFVRKCDPTRPIYYESDLDPGGRADAIGIHYPNEYCGFGQCVGRGCDENYLYPDDAYWLDKDKPHGWKWKKDKPLYIGEIAYPLRDPNPWTLFLGDRAYTSPNPHLESSTYSWRIDIEALRYFGVSAYNPWNIFVEPLPNALWEACREKQAPLAVHVREYYDSFYAEEDVKRTLIVHNDLLEAASLILKWKVSLKEKIIASEELKIALEPAETRVYEARFKTPKVTRKEEITFEFKLLRGEETAFHDRRIYEVHPKVRLTPWKKPPVAVYDKVGETRRLLSDFGVNFVEINEFGNLNPEDYPLFVIGYRSLDDKIAEDAEKIKEYVNKGGTVLCFEQDHYPKWLPIELKLDTFHACTISWPRASGHPLLRGLKESDLRYWNPDHIVSKADFIKPSRGKFRVIIDCGGKSGLSWTPLLEVIEGKGRYVLCQVEVTSKATSEPAAGILLSNLLNYVGARSEIKKTGIIASENGLMERTLRTIGLETENLHGELKTIDLSNYDLILVEGDEETFKHIEENASKITQFIRQGGTILFHKLEPRTAEALGGLLNVPLKLYGSKRERLVKSVSHRLLWGISNHDLFWTDGPLLSESEPELRETSRYFCVIQEDDENIEVLTEPAVLVKIRRGEGSVIIDQILWDEESKERDKAERVISTLITNLKFKD
ncbi:hypothetical protein DRO22_00310 [Candidatus Bathyarchaeota archaeon]|nr:MAG: hypothetical protein DRO22_00310 [Candidatus Bathyarchaeota archaeon]